MVADEPVIKRFNLRLQTRPSHVTRRDYNFEKPRLLMESAAQSEYGGIAIPRVGMEVLVSFLEGDPDQPLITGCLYHKTHQVPYNLPEHKTRSVFKTLSTPGGDGFNELRIDDKAGEEQIFIHAQRDWDQNIQHDQTIRVGNERHYRVETNSYTELLAEEHRTTHADRKTEIKADDHLTVANTQHVKIGTGQFIEAGNRAGVQGKALALTFSCRPYHALLVMIRPEA